MARLDHTRRLALSRVGSRKKPVSYNPQRMAPALRRSALRYRSCELLAQGVLALALSALGAGCTRPQHSSNLEPVRNVVIVCIDTLRADHVGSWGYHRPTTPELDDLARRGVRFANAMATSPWTVPSVASILTSLPPPLHGAGVTGDVRLLGEANPPLQIATGIPTLAEIAAANGFSTALFSANPYLYGRFKDGFGTALVERVDGAKLTDRALEWLNDGDPSPRFLYIQYIDVHQPNLPPFPYFQLFPARDGRPHTEAHGDWSHGQALDLEAPAFLDFRDHRVATYDGSIRFVDAQIARLVRVLEAPPFSGKTLIVVTSDHGEEFWDHALEQAAWRDDPRGIWGVGHGHTLYQELLHVPLILVGGAFSGGRADPCPVSLLDVGPTVLRAAGVPPLNHARGLDLHDRLAIDERNACKDRWLSASSPAYGPDSFSITDGTWKLIESHGRDPQLFDLGSDPRERHSRAAQNAETVRSMSARLASVRRAAARGIAPPPNSTLEADLRALGYL